MYDASKKYGITVASPPSFDAFIMIPGNCALTMSSLSRTALAIVSPLPPK